ncbi:MAG: 5-(carboxyamino)imidazole ribonucleotide mutase [Myxococcales bacterium]|nr:MAG: 5-(carboxyamino)imidazole ribonucleotide mutase [Myxococcales bacterium]
MQNSPLVAVIMGSQNDKEALLPIKEIFNRLEIPFMSRVISAHRTPKECALFAQNAQSKGIKVIIAAAGASAALPGTLAAHSQLPVIGIPLNATALLGLDALFAIAQMPASTPVATMAIGNSGAKNAALLAIRILALSDITIAKRAQHYQQEIYQKAKAQSELEVF